MERRQFLATSALAATAIAGCTSTASQDRDPARGIDGAVPDGRTDRTIEVSANGEVEAEPDEASARVGLEATGDSAEDVERELAERAEELRATFDELGIRDENVESGRYNIRPERDGNGYRGSHSFRLVIEDVDRVGDVIDALARAGADDIGRINFGLSDARRVELREEALDHAFENADEEARHIADNRGVSITGTKSVSTRSVDVVPARAEAYDVAAEADVADDAAAPATDIDSGPVSVSAAVDVVYGFEDRGT
ncbi:DUF541 domain-containing protein [Salinadaptatus halalkaliphilus]|uniref:DUF541 domain-containing protein n=1 Tax=Salinadaptatus halalkaliphilus TaxID=2419781 RepID=A0A4S3TSS2_9EURY|nr:SIMPL domain-containing protein [Salinadaptatus halalkaliphilus]THE66463.1 DUF541 domain-containing protein [Salinadaptatus halalkaliphilus]